MAAVVRVLATSLLVVAVPFALYFLVYQAGRVDYFHGRNMRALDGIARELAGRLTNVEDVLSYKARELDRDYKSGVQRQPVGREKKKKGSAPGTDATQQGGDEAGDAPEAPRLALMTEGGRLSLAIEPLPGEVDAWPTSHARVEFWLESPGSGARVGVRLIDPPRPGAAARSNAYLQVAGVPLASILPRSLVRPYFDELLLVDAEGKVLYELGTANVRITDVSSLVRRAQHGRGGSDGGGAAGGATPEPIPVVLGSSTLLPDLEIAGRHFDLYSVPVSLGWIRDGSEPDPTGDTASGTTTLYLCGLVPSARTMAEVRSISPTVLASLILFLVVGSLAWPYLKVFYISHREQLQGSDLLFLLLSSMFGAGLLALLLLDVLTYRSVHATYDRVLQAVGARIDRAFLAEVEQARSDLECLTDAFQQRGDRTHGSTLDCGSAGLRGATLACQEGDAGLCLVEPADPAVYPPFELGFWLDESGVEVGQWNMRDRFLGKIRVPDRDYFKTAIRGDLWRLPEDADGGRGVFTTRILARAEGELLGILSMRVPLEYGSERVAVIGKRFQSLWKPALPGSFGIAVIDSEGRVLYHSDEHRSLIENLFVETGSMHLQAATEARREVLLPVSYHGREHRFYVRPLAAAPWTLVTFWDQRFVQTANFELLMTCALGIFLYTVLFLVVATLVRTFSTPFRFTWLWPSWQLSSAYLQSICALLSLGIVYLLCAVSLPPGRLLGLAFAVPVLTVAFLYARLREPIWIERRYRRFAYGVLALSGLAVAWAAVWPVGVPDARHAAGRRVGVAVAALVFAWAFFAHWGRQLARFLRAGNRPVAAERVSALVERFGGRVWKDASRTGASFGFTISYVSLLMIVLLVLSAAPAVAIYEDAMPTYWRPFLRFVELEYARALDERSVALASDAVRIAPSRAEAGALAPLGDRSRLAPYDFAAADDGLESAAGWPRIVDVDVPCTIRKCTPPECMRWRDKLWDKVVEESAAAGVASYLPVYNDVSLELRDLLAPEASDGGWCWGAAPRSDDAYTRELLRYRRAASLGDLAIGARQISTRNEVLDDRQAIEKDHRREAIFVAAVLAVLAAVFALIRSLGARVFGLDLPSFPVPPPGGMDPAWCSGRWLLVRPPPAAVDALCATGAVRVLDLRAQASLPLAAPSTTERRGTLVLLHFEYRLIDRAWMKAKLELLEELERTRENLVIVSSVDVLNWLAISAEEGRTAGAGDPAPVAPVQPTSDELARWSTALAQFRLVRFAQPGWRNIRDVDERFPEPGIVRRWKAQTDAAEAVLQRETDWLYELQKIADEVRALPSFASRELADEQIVQQVGDRAEPVYRELWSYLTYKERQACVRLAKGSLLNPRNVDVIRRLMRKGIIVRDPNFRFASRSLRYFVLRAEPRERLEAWEAASESSAWRNLSTPLLVALGLVAVFLFYTNPSFFDAATGFVAAAMAGLPLIFQLLNVFSRGGGRSVPAGD